MDVVALQPPGLHDDATVEQDGNRDQDECGETGEGAGNKNFCAANGEDDKAPEDQRVERTGDGIAENFRWKMPIESRFQMRLPTSFHRGSSLPIRRNRYSRCALNENAATAMTRTNRNAALDGSMP